MRYPLEVLLAGRSKLELEALRQLLDRQSGIKVTTRLINNGHVDPLYNVAPLPDTLIYMVSDLWAEELAALGSRPSSERPPTLVVGPTGDFTQFSHVQTGQFLSDNGLDNPEQILARICRHGHLSLPPQIKGG